MSQQLSDKEFEAARTVYDTVVLLNKALLRAAQIGLHIDLQSEDVKRIGMDSYPHFRAQVFKPIKNERGN